MKKQDLENMAAQDLFDRACVDWKIAYQNKPKRLRACQAWVYETNNFYILRSYNTIIAAIEKSTGYCSDMLRKVYGYTATSAHHIAKFMSDYGDRRFKYTYR